MLRLGPAGSAQHSSSAVKRDRPADASDADAPARVTRQGMGTAKERKRNRWLRMIHEGSSRLVIIFVEICHRMHYHVAMMRYRTSVSYKLTDNFIQSSMQVCEERDILPFKKSTALVNA